jgi:peroxiredoxin
MAQLEPLKDSIAATGGSLIYIAAEKRAGVWNPEKYLRENPVSFPFLLDEDRSVTKAYGLYHRLGRDAINIAHPATLVVDRQKIVRSIYRGEDQHDRAPIEPVLQILRDIKVEASK